MRTISVEVHPDHLARIAKGRKPLLALAELVWNAVDADATQVSISFETDFSGGIEAIHVVDNGTGITPQDAEAGFGRLGGSWKRNTHQTRHEQRLLHGKEGKGRYQAFTLGAAVQWRSCYHDEGVVNELVIDGSSEDLKAFYVSAVHPPDCPTTGTHVSITQVSESANALLKDSALDDLAEIFAFYLRQYPRVKIQYNGSLLDPSTIEVLRADYELDPVQADERIEGVILTVVEWDRTTSRSLYLCDSHGFALHAVNVGIKAPGFNFTAYLRSSYFRKLHDDNALVLGDLEPGVQALHDAAKDKLRAHFLDRSAARAAEVVEDWKRSHIYPYDGEPKGPVEVSERQVFDVIALNVHTYLPDFSATEKRSQQFSLRLLRQAIESNPASVQRILSDVLNLPKQKQDELAVLLEKTTLSSVIAAAKVVGDRLDFLRGLDVLVYDPKSRDELLERSQLHRIVADHTWIFGEEFNLAVDDQSLTEVLRKHRELLGRRELVPEPVRRADGTTGIVDMMLSRRIPHNNATEREHLIVELKRPKQPVNQSVINQVTNYALAVARDERFRDTKTKWVFWAISNNMDDFARHQVRQRNRPSGLLAEYDDPRIEIWAKTWGEVLEDCRGRLTFFQEKLEYTADRASALAYLRQTHEQYFPPSLRQASTS